MMPARQRKGHAMNVVYQGHEVETGQTTVAGFLAERRIDAARAIVEYDGEVHAPGADLAQLPLRAGAALDVFKLTAGG